MIVNPILNGEAQEAPVISVSAGGLITATAGDKSATQQLPTQAAKIVTPGTGTQTAVASGRYTTGNVNVAGSANLVPANIKSGVNIFGVTGTYRKDQYTIIYNNMMGSFPDTGSAGEFIEGSYPGKFQECTIQTEDGENVPWEQRTIGAFTIIKFVMPSKNVTVTIN